MSLEKIDDSIRPEGLDPRVPAMFEERTEEWIEGRFGFGRVRQAYRDRLGYETTEVYRAKDSDIISWTWLASNGLVANGDRMPTESEKQRGLSILRERIDDLIRRLGP
jgi:hypothetical protein